MNKYIFFIPLILSIGLTTSVYSQSSSTHKTVVINTHIKDVDCEPGDRECQLENYPSVSMSYTSRGNMLTVNLENPTFHPVSFSNAVIFNLSGTNTNPIVLDNIINTERFPVTTYLNEYNLSSGHYRLSLRVTNPRQLIHFRFVVL